MLLWLVDISFYLNNFFFTQEGITEEKNTDCAMSEEIINFRSLGVKLKIRS